MVVVIYGGKSSEHEVSIVSARTVVDGLLAAKYEVGAVYVHRDGASKSGEVGPIKELKHFALSELAGIKDCVAFPIIHGTTGEDGCLQGCLEFVGVPYIGEGVLASAVGMHKGMQKQLFVSAGLPVLPFVSCTAEHWKKNRSDVLRHIIKVCGKRYPLFVKPVSTGSSVGVFKVMSADELPKAIVGAFKHDSTILIESGLDKPREVECGILGGPMRNSVFGEISYEGAFYDYEAKYHDSRTALLIPAKLAAGQLKQLQKHALKACEVLNIAHYARVDFFIERKTGKIFLNEVNTIPGFTSGSMFPMLWKHSGVPIAKLMKHLVQLAYARSGVRTKKDNS
jgi:D-alanine-D-alanine ligase